MFVEHVEQIYPVVRLWGHETSEPNVTAVETAEHIVVPFSCVLDWCVCCHRGDHFTAFKWVYFGWTNYLTAFGNSYKSKAGILMNLDKASTSLSQFLLS